MKTIWKVTLGFAIGLVVGLIPAYHFYRVFWDSFGRFSSLQLTEMSINARQIEKGRSDEVLSRYKLSIPSAVVVVHDHFMSDPGSTNALWAAQRFYADSPSNSAPAEAKRILDSLPPRPQTSCDVKCNAKN